MKIYRLHLFQKLFESKYYGVWVLVKQIRNGTAVEFKALNAHNGGEKEHFYK